MKTKILLSIITLLFFSCSAEKSLIKQARKSNQIDGYENYLSKYEDGEYADEAIEQIEDIKFSQSRDSVFASFIKKLETHSVTKNDKISILPSNKVLMGTYVNIELHHLHPNKTYTLHAYRRRWKGLFYSFATFQSDSNGQVFLNKEKPKCGTYSDADQLGVFWSMTRPSLEGLDLLFKIDELEWDKIYLYLEADEKILENDELKLLTNTLGVISKKIHNDTLTAQFHYPESKNNLPAIILVGPGSGGAYHFRNQFSKTIASHGYATFVLSYTNVDGLPKHVEKIPLEYFFNAIDWIKQQPNIDSDRLIILGGSRAGEFVLLLASMDSDIKGVIAGAPSNVIWQSLPHSLFSLFFTKPAWTINGKGLPFLKHKNQFSLTWKFISGSKQIEIIKCYEGIIEDKEKIEPAIIKVEKINGPILFIAGKDDCLWPTYQMCQMMEQRLDSLNFKFPVQGLYYDEAGHDVLSPNLPPTIEYKYEQIKYGGTAAGNAAAQIDSWNRMLEFLKKYFPSNGD